MRHAPPIDITIASPKLRTSAQGPVDMNVTRAVRAVNPVLDELLHALNLLETNDASLTQLDLTNSSVLTNSLITAIASSLLHNTQLKKLVLASVNLSTKNAQELAQVLRVNKTLEVLDLENNQIGPLGMRAIADMLAVNEGLVDVRVGRQKQLAGTDAEQCFARALVGNFKVVKFSLVVRDVSSRHLVDKSVSRNKEVARKARLTL